MSTGLVAKLIVKVIAVQVCVAIDSSPPGILHKNFPNPSVSPPAKNVVENTAWDKDETVATCSDSIWDMNPKAGLFHTFTAMGVHNCWLYCKATFKCHALIYEFINSTCLLFNKDFQSLWKGKKELLHVSLVKACMVEQENATASVGASIPEIVSLSRSGIGFFILQGYHSSYQTTVPCLAKREKSKRKFISYDAEIYRVTWEHCKVGTTTRWVLKEALGMGIDLYQISLADEPELCLDVELDVESEYDPSMQVIVSKCRDVFLTNLTKEDPQIMLITAAREDSTKHSIFSISGIIEEKQHTILFTGNDMNHRDSLEGISLMDPMFFNQTEEQPYCALSQFYTHHGKVRNKENVPFFLRGSKVDIHCDQGYGVKFHNFSGLQTLKCDKDAKPLPCRRIIPKKSCGGKNADKELSHVVFMMLAIVSTIVALILLVVLMMLKRKTGNDEDEKKEAKASQ